MVSSVFGGIQGARNGPTGPTGPTGSSGASGASGATGATGRQGAGVLMFRRKFSTSTSNTNPGSGYFRFNHASPQLADGIPIHFEDIDAVDQQALLVFLETSDSDYDGVLRIELVSDPDTYYLFPIYDVDEHLGWATILLNANIGYQVSTALSADAECWFTFFPTGNRGSAGSPGATGPTGPTGALSTYVREIVLENDGAALAADQVFDLYFPNDCTIDSWVLLADQTGSVSLDLLVDSYANFPPLSGADWTPADHATAPHFWFKAEDATGTNGNAITAWSDASGNGHTATSTAWPIYRSNDLNGLPSIDFGTSKHVEVATTITGSTLTAFALTRRVTSPAAATYARVLSLSKTSQDDYNSANRVAAFLRDNTSSDMATFHNSSARNFASNSMTVDTWKFYTVRFNGTDLDTWWNGTAGSSYTVTSPSWDIGRAMIGAEKDAGSTIASYFNGKINEFILWLGSLSDADVDKVTGYLAWKWGQEASLPGGHTYAGAAPTVGTSDSIVASAYPAISSSDHATDSTLTGWTTAISAGDTMRVLVRSCTGIERLTLSLVIQE